LVVEYDGVASLPALASGADGGVEVAVGIVGSDVALGVADELCAGRERAQARRLGRGRRRQRGEHRRAERQRHRDPPPHGAKATVDVDGEGKEAQGRAR
jgi:hypothetical protein